jgi:hypothetical protein
MFHGLSIPDKIDQRVVLLYGSKTKEVCGGGRVYFARDYVNMFKKELKGKKIQSSAIPEYYPLLRTIQIALE